MEHDHTVPIASLQQMFRLSADNARTLFDAMKRLPGDTDFNVIQVSEFVSTTDTSFETRSHMASHALRSLFCSILQMYRLNTLRTHSTSTADHVCNVVHIAVMHHNDSTGLRPACHAQLACSKRS